MKAKLLLAVISVSLLFAGCSKENLSGEAKIYRIYAGGQLQGEYFYTTQGSLQGHTVYAFPGRKSSELTFHYDGNGRLIKRESAYDFSSGPNPHWSYGYTDYSYGADGKITEERHYQMQNNVYVLVSKTKPTYGANGRLISQKLLLPNDVAFRLKNYQYDNKGNIILQEEYGYNGSVPEIEYRYRYDSYDNKLNPYQGLMSTVPPFSINTNNILQTTVINYVLTPGTPVTTSNNTVYNSYNQNGFPVRVFENGTDFTLEYK